MFSFLGGVDDIFYGHSPSKRHDNPSAQRQLSVSSLGEVGESSMGVLLLNPSLPVPLWWHPGGQSPSYLQGVLGEPPPFEDS